MDGSTSPTSGDKAVDGVDNSVTPGCGSAAERPESAANGANRTESTHSSSPDRGQAERVIDRLPEGLSGSDLARAALAAARAAAKSRTPAKRTMPAVRRGRRRRWSGAGADDRDPQPLGRLVSRLAVDRGWSDQLSGGQVFAKWPQLVGAEVAQHAKPVTLREGELVVQAESTAWATQLRLLQRQLLQQIAKGVGPNVVKRLKVQGPSAPNWRFGPLHAPGRGPRDTYG